MVAVNAMGTAAAAALLVCAAGCSMMAATGSGGTAVHEVQHGGTISDTRRALAKIGLPPVVFGHDRPDLRLLASTGSHLSWSVEQEGVSLMRYSADLAPGSGGGTQVSLSLIGATPVVEQRLADSPSIRNLYLAAMQEQVASTLERRNYDMGRITGAITTATFANIGSIAASMDRAEESSLRADRLHTGKARKGEAAGGDL